jgi:uncharacterized protein YdhG (YjbR/CyaY superfamily)
MEAKKEITTIDAYIQEFPMEVQERLNQVRTLIKELAPDATEKMSYAMPTFFLKKNLVHFAAFKNHIGLYPLPETMAAFDEELKNYKKGKGSVQFPFNEPLPLELIERMVRSRLKEL